MASLLLSSQNSLALILIETATAVLGENTNTMLVPKVVVYGK